MRRTIAVPILLVLAAASCGAEKTTDEQVASEHLSEAFTRTADSEMPLRVSTSLGQVMRSSALGVDFLIEVDPERPIATVEVEPDGDLYHYVDLGPVVAPVLAVADLPPAAAEAFDEAHVEMWTVGDELVIDATGYQAIANLTPEADLGPFEPGLGVVDLTRVAATGDDLVSYLVGTGVSDFAVVAERLPMALNDVEPDADHPNTYIGLAAYADVFEALGGDWEMVRLIAGDSAANFGVDADVVAQFLEDYFHEVESEVTVRVRADGTIESFRVVADLSGYFDAFFDPESGLSLGLSDDELTGARSASSDFTWIMDFYTMCELDDTIVVTPPEGDFEDRTEDAIALFASLDG